MEKNFGQWQELISNLENYKEPELGSFKWLSCYVGMEKIKDLIAKDEDVKNALHNLIAMTLQLSKEMKE